MDEDMAEFAQEVVDQTAGWCSSWSYETGVAIDELRNAGFNMTYDRLLSSSSGLELCNQTNVATL